MRSLLFFDLPTTTSKDRRAYRKFIKDIKQLGFYMIQESVYAKMSIDEQNMKYALNKLKTKLPSFGSVMVLNVTEKQFSSMDILLGDIQTDVITSDERTIVL